MSLSEDAKFLKADMRKHGAQASWNWEADLRFAEFIDDAIAVDCLKTLLGSAAPFPLQIASHRACVTRTKRRRLRALRFMKDIGIVETGWIGTGEGGATEFGPRRIRYYGLVEK
jgi:hypothetical protein